MIESPVAYAVCAHEWANEYYGSRCTKCDLFYADGNAPWDYVDEAAIEREEAIYNYKAPCEVCGGEFWDGGTSCRCDQPPVILGLDASSVMLGWVVLDGQTVRDFGEVQLKHSDIAERCRLARAYIAGLLRVHPDVDAAAMETPVLKRFKKGTNIKALIPQCYVQGALRGLLAEMGILVCDVAPAEAKKALEGTGGALKQGMGDAAACYGVVGEHAADALGVALFGLGRVEVVR